MDYYGQNPAPPVPQPQPAYWQPQPQPQPLRQLQQPPQQQPPIQYQYQPVQQCQPIYRSIRWRSPSSSSQRYSRLLCLSSTLRRLSRRWRRLCNRCSRRRRSSLTPLPRAHRWRGVRSAYGGSGRSGEHRRRIRR